MSVVRLMRRRPTSFSLILILGAILVVVAVASQPTLGQDSSDQEAPGEWCPAGTVSLDVLILMDQSRSLRRMDPERRRIEAAENLILSLQDEAARGVRVRVALATFGTDFELRAEFTDLAKRGTEGLIAELGGFTQHDWNTDYVLALYGATNLDWSAECNKVVWYTDGEHDLTDAPKGGRDSRVPRAYDSQSREIVSARIGRTVQALLVPAVCGAIESSEVDPRYGDLSDRLAALDVEVEFALYYFGDLEKGDSERLITMMERGECGDGVILDKVILDPDEPIVFLPPTTTTTTTTTTTSTTTTTTTATTTTLPPPPPICEGLPPPHLPAGRDVVWSGAVPDGISPAFVRSVIVRATGDSPALSSDHPSQTPGEDGVGRTLTLDFSDVPLSSYAPSYVAVRGEGIDEACITLVLETPSLESHVVTSPIFPDSPNIQVRVEVGGIPIPVADVEHLSVSVNGERIVGLETVAEGLFQIPPQSVVGDHRLEVRLESDHAGPAVVVGSFAVSSKPDGPILRLAATGLDPVAATVFTIPIAIDDVGREGEIRLLAADPIIGTDGETVSVELRFPDDTSVWSSGSPKPNALTVILADSVQTPDRHILHLDYESDPSDPAGDLVKISLAVPVDIDHPRNLVLERIIVAVLLALLLLVIWAWLYVINRLAGRIRRPRRDIRWRRFRVDEAWILSADPTGEGHRRPKHTPSRLDAGRLRAKRKTYLRVWKFPTVELSMDGSRRFIGLVGGGFRATEIQGRSAEFPEARLHGPIVLVDVSAGPPFEGVVMAPTDPSGPTEDQLTGHAARALERLRHPDRTTTNQEK